MKFNKEAVFTVLASFLAIVLLEISLNLLARASPSVEALLSSPYSSIPRTIPDSRLGHRPNPGLPGHDSKGFRNPYLPSQADIVGLGDSQTYGTSVESQDAWPRQLESMTGRTVYNMAFGGYGPLHSLILWDEAVALRPKVIIEAFYAGNDLYDSFQLVYNRGQFPELKSEGQSVRSSVQSAEELESIVQRVTRILNMDAPNDEIDEKDDAQKSSFPLRFLLRFLSQHSTLYGLVQRVRYEVVGYLRERKGNPPSASETWDNVKRFAEEHPGYREAFESGAYKTVFTSALRLAVLDLQDPRIAEGHQMSLQAIRRMNDLAADHTIRFLVVLIPTKELVFYNLVRSPTASYRALIEMEELFWRRTVDFLERHGTEYVDALPALRKQLLAGNQPYHLTHDGHPNTFGHKAIAELIQ